ncbi:SIMPL domain-containing protein [Lacinutrix sp. C3R15]|uniref:SIMPL domain-containing protein n=1 Tax=Flavobacteriaceae TaxID=49546 RepID=UPI001C0872A4|nr:MULTISPECIES: SIMPL domain-containing protein [Flavobacteriaceae]MBU2940044.1 SIMPL domain-containing protein [Lacinutrix sp. C3R15]MDO6623361.1 SIMPL domain-containing protein [Oceanihabitans sp. 1_MG-2023]
MKKFIITTLIILYTATNFAQIKGNAISISRQNIASKDLGNGYVYGNNYNHFTSANLIPNPTINLEVKALSNIIASSYTAVFNVTQIGKTSEETNNLIKERTQKLKSDLAAKGLLTNDFIIDVISFVPVYETIVEKKLFSKKYVEVPKGFELQQNIHIKFTKVNQFETILAACANNEIYNLVKVDYFIDNLQEVYKQLRIEILKELKVKQEFYKNLGFNLIEYTPIIADNKYCYFPRDFYKNYQAFNSVSMEALKKNRGVYQVKKQTSYYYDPISFRDYDVVINPSIVEPVIQIGMEIKLQYTPKPKQEKSTEKEVIKNKYYIISPDGSIDIKEIKTT